MKTPRQGVDTSALARRFRPMTFREIMDRSFEAYRASFSLLTGLAAVALVPLSAGLLCWLWFMERNRDLWGTREFSILALPFVLGIAVALFFSYVARGAQIYAISRRATGATVRVGECLRYALRRTGTLTLVGAVSLALALVGLVLYLIPGFAVIAFSTFAWTAAIIEGQQYFRAFRRSTRLAWRSMGKLILVHSSLFAFHLLAFINLLAIRYLAVKLGHSVLGLDTTFLAEVPYGVLVTLMLVILLLHPFRAAAAVMLYIDARVRTEGWDLVVRIDEVATSQAGGKGG